MQVQYTGVLSTILTDFYCRGMNLSLLLLLMDLVEATYQFKSFRKPGAARIRMNSYFSSECMYICVLTVGAFPSVKPNGFM